MLQRGINDLPVTGNLQIDTHAAYRGQFRKNPNDPYVDPFRQPFDPKFDPFADNLNTTLEFTMTRNAQLALEVDLAGSQSNTARFQF